MVVAELGSDATAWALQLEEQGVDPIVVQQVEGEDLSDLATRVRNRVEAIVAAGHTLGAAVLVSDGSWDTESLSSRNLAVRAMVSSMVAVGRGRLVLVSDDGRGKSHRGMEAFASVVGEAVRGTGVDVEHRPASGVFRRVA